MPQSLSSDQQAQRGVGQNLADGWGLPQSFSNMPLIDPAVLGAADATSQPTGELWLAFHYLHLCPQEVSLLLHSHVSATGLLISYHQ